MLGGRRIWLVSGTIDYARTPRGLWCDRLLAARQAGLNCVATTCVWGLHEPRPGRFEFTDDLDVAAFLGLIAELGMFGILRVGPCVGSGYDLGGIPPWLAAEDGLRLRTDDPAFLEPMSRYLRALLRPLADMQATRGEGRPLILVQGEDHYFLDDAGLVERYLGRLGRVVRECGIDVPIINASNLWNSVEGQIDAWVGSDDLLGMMRQLHAVRPEAPRLVADLPTGEADAWDEPSSGLIEPNELLHRAAQVLAGGGQFNLSPFHGGTNLGFNGGRRADGGTHPSFVTTSNDCGAPLGEAGARTANYHAIRRIAMFADSFGRIFAALDPDDHPATADPARLGGDAVAGRSVSGEPSVLHVRGGQGSIVFLFSPASGGPKAMRASTTVLLSSGVAIPVTMPDQAVAWCLCDVRLGGRATLNHTNLCALTQAGRSLVLFGAPGSEGIVSINDSETTFVVPSGNTALVEQHEDVTLVICNPALVDAMYVHEDVIHIGVAGLNSDSSPIAHPRFSSYQTVSTDGVVATHSISAKPPRAARIGLKDWRAVTQDQLVTGEYARYAPIDGPASLQACGAPTGYGYYRIQLKSSGRPAENLCLPHSGDRLAVYADGSFVGIIGFGPGTVGARLSLDGTDRPSTLVFLADNLGRYDAMERLGDAKGLVDPLYETAPVELSEPEMVEASGIDPSKVVSPLFFHREGELTDHHRLCWTLDYRKKAPLLLSLDGCDHSVVLLVDGHAVGAHIASCADSPLRFVADRTVLRRGVNRIELAPFDELTHVADDLAGAFRVDCLARDLSAGAAWSFAKWGPPERDAYRSIGDASAREPAGRPAWYRCEFRVRHTNRPLWLDVGDLSKGQLYVNGRNVGRYFAHGPNGAPVGPQHAYYLPEPWLRVGELNELVIFDEHGADPRGCTLTYRETMP